MLYIGMEVQTWIYYYISLAYCIYNFVKWVQQNCNTLQIKKLDQSKLIQSKGKDTSRWPVYIKMYPWQKVKQVYMAYEVLFL